MGLFTDAPFLVTHDPVTILRSAQPPESAILVLPELNLEPEPGACQRVFLGILLGETDVGTK